MFRLTKHFMYMHGRYMRLSTLSQQSIYYSTIRLNVKEAVQKGLI